MTYANLQCKLILGLFLMFCGAGISGAQPPPQPAVNPAEWEAMSGVLIRYPVPFTMSALAEMAEDVEVKTIVSDETQLQTAYNQYDTYGINMSNCTWLIAPTNSYVVRDYGPWYNFTGDGVQGIVDHIYNRPTRPDDNLIPMVLGDTLGIPVYGLPLIHCGGNYMSDGMGVGMSTRLVLDENPGLSSEEVDSIMFEYLGLDLYHKFEYVEYGTIHHIDCWAKILNPGKVIVRCLDPPDPLLDARADYISTLMSSYGRPYEVIRVDCVTLTAYTNSLILNDKVFVPLANDPLDQQALQTYREAMPGYEVLGFTGCGTGNNAIHCRTMGITDRYMLRITHIPIFDQENFGQDFPVQAAVHAYSNMPLLTGMPQVYWNVEGGDYNILTMTHTVGDSFSASIPSQPDNTNIYYYIHAEDDSSRSENHPYIGPGNPHHFYVGPDIEPPTIETTIPVTILPLSLPYTITAEVRDNRWISSVTLEYSINGIPIDTLDLTLQPLSAVIYENDFDPPIIPGDIVQLRIKAVDNSISQNTTYAPEVGYYEIDIVGQLRACVWNPCLQPSGQTIFELLQTGGIQCFYTEEEPVIFNRFSSIFVCLGSFASAYNMNLNQVNKIIDYIQSGHRIYLEGSDCWAYSPYHDLLSEAFGIIGYNDGPLYSSVNPLLGAAATFTSGMSFNSSNNGYIDRIGSMPGSDAIFTNADTAYAVAQETADYKTVGMSVEFGSLTGNNPQSSQTILLQQIIRFFKGHSDSDGINVPAENSNVVYEYKFNAPYPNPFNQRVALDFALPASAPVKLTVYDIQGREVANLVDGYESAGMHEVVFDAKDLVSGVYFVRLEAAEFSQVQKIVLMK